MVAAFAEAPPGSMGCHVARSPGVVCHCAPQLSPRPAELDQFLDTEFISGSGRGNDDGGRFWASEAATPKKKKARKICVEC